MDALNGRTHVNVLHPYPLIAIGLEAALRDREGISIHGSGGTPPANVPIDVVIANYEQGVELASRGRASPGRIMIVASEDREHEVRYAMEAGVHGYILLGCGIEELIAGIRALSHGLPYMCLAAAQRIAESMSRESFTARETDVLELLGQGCCNKTIARKLNIAEGTVKTHVKGILSKLNASSRTQAVSIAIARGLIGASARITEGVPRGNTHRRSYGAMHSAVGSHPGI